MKKKYLSFIFIIFLFSNAVLKAESISGIVYDENNEPLPGVAVTVEGSRLGTVTDIDGKYTIDGVTPGEVVLQFSFIGYLKETKRVTVEKGKNATFNTTMQVDTQTLDEVVVVGYGVKRKRDLTNSVVTLETKDITDIPTPSFENGIQGKAAGVQVITGSGLAGSGSMVRVRGVASVSAGGDPLYVIDGVPITQDYFLNGNGGGFNTNPLAAINPNDIENISILKDAAATGIYGSRGSNGVILITTKRGKSKGLKYNFSSRIGFSQPTSRPNMLNSSDYLRLYEEAWVNDGNVGTPQLPGNTVSWDKAHDINTDWVDQTIRTGFKQKYDFGVSKGAQKYNWYAGVSYQGDNSYLAGNSYDRMSARFNVDYNLTQRLKLGFSSSLSRGVNNRIDAAWSGGLGAAMSTALPIYPIYWDKDTIDQYGNAHKKGDYWTLAGVGNNPVAQRELKDWKDTELRTINNISLEYKLGKSTYLKVFGGLDYMNYTSDVFEKPGFDLGNVDTVTNRPIGKAFLTNFEVINTNGNVTLNHIWEQSANNVFTFLVGAEYQYSKTNKWDTKENFYARAPISESGIYSNNPLLRLSEWAFASAFARINYSFKNKYILEALVRSDGSSRFGENYKYGIFPAFSAGWIMTDEKFMKNMENISYLKLKASYGINGNSNFELYQVYDYYQIQNNGYNNQTYLYPTQRNNPNLKWETSKTFDMALEYGLFNDRITGELGYYYKQTDDMLLRVTLQKANGFSNWWDNVGGAYNTGLELAVNTKNIVGTFFWETNLNVSRNYNEITSIGNYTEDAVGGGTNDTRVVVGSPIGTNFLVRFSHIDNETGRPVYLDKNGNETFNWSADDRVAVGAVMPDAVGGITNRFGYKNWELSVLFYFSIGGKIYDSSAKRQLGVVSDWNMREDIFGRWQQPGDDADYPVLTRDPENYGNSDPWINTDFWLYDATYLRLRNVSLSYNINPAKLERLKLQSMRVTATATNIFTWAASNVLDPEIARDFENATDRNMSPNISYLTPPQEMTFNLMVQIGF